MARDLRSILDAVFDGVIVLDEDARVEIVNGEACRILEQSAGGSTRPESTASHSTRPRAWRTATVSAPSTGVAASTVSWASTTLRPVRMRPTLLQINGIKREIPA